MFKLLKFLLYISFPLLVGNCRTTPKMEMKQITLQARVRMFENNALHENYEGGDFKVFHRAFLEIQEPIDFKGLDWVVYWESDNSKGSDLALVGNVVEFSIDRDTLKSFNSGEIVFVGALDKLKIK